MSNTHIYKHIENFLLLELYKKYAWADSFYKLNEIAIDIRRNIEHYMLVKLRLNFPLNITLNSIDWIIRENKPRLILHLNVQIDGKFYTLFSSTYLE